MQLLNGESISMQGLHSWIQFHLEERRGNLQYQGYLQPGGCEVASCQDHVNC